MQGISQPDLSLHQQHYVCYRNRQEGAPQLQDSWKETAPQLQGSGVRLELGLILGVYELWEPSRGLVSALAPPRPGEQNYL